MRRLTPLILLTGFLAANYGIAGTVYWTNPNGGIFETNGNWNTGMPPGTADTAVFGSSANVATGMNITFTGNVTNTALDVQDGGPQNFNVGASNTYTLTEPLSTGFSVTVGDIRSSDNVAGNATLTLSSGTLSAQAVGIGVGGTGTLTVASGAVLNNADSLNVAVGQNQSGTLNIDSGATVTSTNTTSVNTIGNETGSSGTVNVMGGTWTTNSELAVGSLGTGTLTVSNGGSGSNVGVLAIGNYAGPAGTMGTMKLTGSGTSWSSTASTGAGQVNVGDGGTGYLIVTNNATLTSQKGNSGSGSSGIIGFSGGTGTATISANGSWTQNGGLRVGDGSGSTGTLNILSGGTVSSVSGSVGYLQGSGTVLVSGAGSSWSNTGTLDIGTTGTGTVTIAAGGAISGTTITVGSNGTLNSAGGTITGNLVNNGGVVLGDAPGNLTVHGSYTNNGTLTFYIASATDYSQLFIDGTGSAGNFTGTIDFDFIDGFAPTNGETFDFIEGTNGGTVGVFAPTTENYSGLGSGYMYHTTYAPGPDGSVVFDSDSNGVPTSTPEPSALVLAGFGLAALWFGRKLRGLVI